MADLARRAPGVDVLVVDDGSDDGTRELLAALGVGHVTLPLRVGLGGALRAGILYAVRHRYRHVVRMDGDGQHRARDIGALIEPITRGRADAVVGSRYVGHTGRARRRGPGRRVLALGLSAITGRAITDPTSGFWVFGPRALALLSRCHPTGYPEPELRLLLHRHVLRVEEVGIRVRPRHAGRTTLTWARTAVALARTLLAFVIVPLRPAEPRAARHGE
jgi:glycosyltransferase involved in cell wall biosynthesis